MSLSKLDPTQYQRDLPPSSAAIRAYLGGSFDPVHNGHLQMAMAVFNQLLPLAKRHHRFLEVSLLPTARSPFKDHSTKPAHRLAMLKLAIQATPLTINTLELYQSPPVYSIDTLKQLRQQYPADSLIFIMGADSAASLDRWKAGLMLTDYVHLWVFGRPKSTNSPFDPRSPSADIIDLLPKPLIPRVTKNLHTLLYDTQAPLNQPLKIRRHGRIYKDSTNIIAVSSSQLRDTLASYHYACQDHLPDVVLKYIRHQRLYYC